jgi:hypothetical protein
MGSNLNAVVGLFYFFSNMICAIGTNVAFTCLFSLLGITTVLETENNAIHT